MSRDFRREIAIARRVEPVGPSADDGDRVTLRGERAAMRCSVDAER